MPLIRRHVRRLAFFLDFEMILDSTPIRHGAVARECTGLRSDVIRSG
jgi:hypothetical protein